ncbi:hypothetical protein AB5J56_33560 [Streptomyces sp. R21]|uniref:Uncharacterized protein n=1 Tax=Streptomyces sp. R21 TaxID=3238627 RepID=A0AB39PE23_9ACTN
MPLPRLVLTESQSRLLAELMLDALPDPAAGAKAQEAVLARGLDADEVLSDVPELAFLGLVVREGGAVAATDLGAALHFEALHEAVELRLSNVVRFVETVDDPNSRWALAVRRLAHGDISLDDALAGVDQMR